MNGRLLASANGFETGKAAAAVAAVVGAAVAVAAKAAGASIRLAAMTSIVGRVMSSFKKRKRAAIVSRASLK